MKRQSFAFVVLPFVILLYNRNGGVGRAYTGTHPSARQARPWQGARTSRGGSAAAGLGFFAIGFYGGGAIFNDW